MATLPHAMSIPPKYDVLESFRRAEAYAGEAGRIATLPDLVSARVAGAKGAWEEWYTTSTALYFGLSRSNTPILMVAHGIGPLMSHFECSLAYSNLSLTRNNAQYGRVRHGDFAKLEGGFFGDVSIIDAKPYLDTSVDWDCLRYRIDFTGEQASDPLFRAMFGKDSEAYMRVLVNARREDTGLRCVSEVMVSLDNVSRCSFEYKWANFLVLKYGTHGVGMQDFKTAKFVAVRDKEPIKKIRRGIDPEKVAMSFDEARSALDKVQRDLSLMVALQEMNLL